MNWSAFQQLHAIGHLTHAFKHYKWSIILWTELSVATWRKGLSGAVEQAKPQPVPHSKLKRAVIGVVEPARMLLGLKKRSAHLSKNLSRLVRSASMTSIWARPET